MLLKIADYGISQVSQGLTFRVGNNPVGTPGFMAPELFENPGQEVSSEKVYECCHNTILLAVIVLLIVIQWHCHAGVVNQITVRTYPGL